jgi:cell division protein FtsI/penicillin-binding protein 2
MKFLQAAVMVAALFGSTQGFAKVEQCRFIGAKPDREACYDRQAKALAAQKAEVAAKPRSTDPIEQMKQDDEALSLRLKNICRGC